MSDELPVITSIDELPESAIEEFTNGNEIEVSEKPTIKAAQNPEVVETSTDIPEEPKVDDAPVEEVVKVEKPKRKRRTKAEIEAAKAAEVEANN